MIRLDFCIENPVSHVRWVGKGLSVILPSPIGWLALIFWGVVPLW